MRTAGWMVTAAAVFALGRGADAATISVTSGNNAGAGTLRDAIANANPGDTIQIASGVTVRLEGDLTIPAGKANLTIEGPPPNGVKQQATVTQGTPAPVPPAHVVVDAPGVTIRQIGFDGVRVDVHGNQTTIHTCDFDGKGATDGVDVSGATGTSVGTADNANTFKNCIVAVAVKDSTDTTVTNNLVTKSGVGVTSQDDANITVTGNTVKDGDGVLVSGSSGAVSNNKLTPDKKAGVGVDVGPGAGAAGTKGPMSVQGNDVKVKGKAAGVQVHGRTDVAVTRNTIDGKTTGTGVALTCEEKQKALPVEYVKVCDPWAGTPGYFAITDNHVTGCRMGILVDTTGAVGATGDVGNNSVDRSAFAGYAFVAGDGSTIAGFGNMATQCPGAGYYFAEGPQGTLTSSGDTSDRCGGGAAAGGVLVVSGAVKLMDVRVSNSTSYGVHVGAGAFAEVSGAEVSGARRGGMFVDDGATLTLSTLPTGANRKADVIVAPEGTLVLSQAAADDFETEGRKPTFNFRTPSTTIKAHCDKGTGALVVEVSPPPPPGTVVRRAGGPCATVDASGVAIFSADVIGDDMPGNYQFIVRAPDGKTLTSSFFRNCPPPGAGGGSAFRIQNVLVEEPSPGFAANVDVFIDSDLPDNMLGHELVVKEGAKEWLRRTVGFKFHPYIDSFPAVGWVKGTSHVLDVFVDGVKIGSRTVTAK